MQAGTAQAVVFECSPDLEPQFLAAISTVPGFATTYIGELNPRYFQLKAHELWAKAAFELVKKYGKPPGFVAIREAAGALVGSVSYEDIRPQDLDAVRVSVERAAEADLGFATDQARKFCRKQMVLGLMHEARAAVDQDMDAFMAKLAKATRFGDLQGQQPVVRYLRDCGNRILARRTSEYDRFIPTGIGRLDTMLLGGLRRGKMGLILAPSRGGKTSMMIDIAAGALEQGFKVLFISHEVTPRDLQDRLDCRLTGIPVALLRENEHIVTQRLSELRRSGGEIVLQFWARHTSNVGSIRTLLHKLREDGFDPDLLVEDYAELQKDPPNVTEERKKSGYKYGDFFSLCREEELAGWTGSQLNRDAFYNGRPRLDMTAEDISKIAITDVAVLIGANEDMEAKNQCRLTKGKDRDREDGQSELVEFHRQLQRFC